MTNTAQFEELIRGADGPEGVAGLMAALGLEVAARRVALGGRRRLGVGDEPAIADMVRLVERPGFLVLLIELAVEANRGRLTSLARRVRNADPSCQLLLLFAEPGYRSIVIAVFGLEGELRHLTLERASVRRTDVETLADMVGDPGEGPVALVARYSKALDRTRVTRRFFVDFRGQRSRVADAWSGVPVGARTDREQLALLFLCRLMFLYFLQRQGHLAGDRSFVPRLFDRWRRGRGCRTRSFFAGRLDALFFGALNTRPEQRRGAARRLGDLPYLNGGLFERTALERRYPELDLGDDIVAGVFDDLLERYRFNAHDSASAGVEGEASVDIDPEMLGRVFEGVMAASRRGDTGTFFTPAAAVDRLVRATLEAHIRARIGRDVHALAAGENADARVLDVLRDIRVLDPACGSGAFLLGALTHLSALRRSLGETDAAAVRRDIVTRCLHGVDSQADAALLCALRLWLALSIVHDGKAGIEPLPNLDRRVRQGDALLDPLDIVGAGGAAGGARSVPGSVVRAAARSLAPVAMRYVTAEPGERAQLQSRLVAGEAALARAWLAFADRDLSIRQTEQERLAAQRDLWGNPDRQATEASVQANRLAAERRELGRLRRAVDDEASLPFFSFGVHFADPWLRGFDLILMNPPWVRAHRWPAALRACARGRYRVCRGPGWPAGARLAGAPLAAGAQVDLALLFVERALGLLSERGTLGAMIPAKTFRCLYGGASRSMLLKETRIASIEDHGLDHHGVFTADAFAGSIVATRVACADVPDESDRRDVVIPQPGRRGRAREERADERSTAPARPRIVTPDSAVQVRLHRKSGDPLDFAVAQADLPLVPGDLRAPWLLAPPDAAAAFRRMQESGPPLGERHRVRRGIFTGANDVLLVREAAPRIGGLAWIRAEGRFRKGGRSRAPRRSAYEALIESASLAPALRGAGVEAWRFRPDGFVVWSYDQDGRYHEPTPRLEAYLARHATRLGRRSGGAGSGATLYRVSRDALGPRVVWHDLADRLKAVAVPATVRTPFGRSAPVVPLNTVYFIPVGDDAEAGFLAALLNSLPVRCFVRAIAERAKDARFRFFAWTVAVLPLPGMAPRELTERMVRIAADAHAAGAIDDDAQEELDSTVAALYRLDDAAVAAIRSFDDWLSGRHS